MLDALLIAKTLRVPAPEGRPGDGTAVARQLDAALLSVGFKASRDLLAHLGGIDSDDVITAAVPVLAAVKRLVGDHAQHNVYFRDFPRNVPDAMEFWLSLLAKALVDAGGNPLQVTTAPGGLNLLALPGYGTYQHSYADMLAAHDQLIPADSDRVTVLHLGRSLAEEAAVVYLEVAGAATPLSEDDARLLEWLAALCADSEQPGSIPVRETRAIVNRVRLAHGKPLLADTVTDVLRLACAVSGGDVSLQAPTRFVSLARRDRRALMDALERIVAADPRKLGDVNANREAWKRLGERLHPHEFPFSRLPHQSFPSYGNARNVFAVARGEAEAPSLASRAESAFAAGDIPAAVRVLSVAPGLLLRSVDRAARLADRADVPAITRAVADAAPKASGRVLLSLREHLDNRAAAAPGRIFVNRAGRAHVEPDYRAPIDRATISDLTAALDGQLAARLPEVAHLVVDPAVHGAAIPLSGKSTPGGFGVLPRGSRAPVRAGHVRFFVHWMQREHRTDFDLSALLLDEKFNHAGHLSYTSLSGYGGVHSGDITDAPGPHGGSEFIDLDLSRVKAAYVVPQVNVYSGEGFDEVAESFFGYMEREAWQAGRPFEARTVRMKSDLRGPGRVALPMVFERGKGGWSAVWMQLFLRGMEWRNQVEGNRLSTALLARSIAERRYLTVRHLVELWQAKAGRVSEWREGMLLDGPVTFVGLERPDGLPEGSEVFDLGRLNALVPA